MPVMSQDIPFDSPLHRRLLQALEARRRLSESRMSDRYSAWEETDKQFQLEVTERDADAIRRAKRAEGEKQYVDIHVPYAYGMLMAAHTYLTSIFLSRDPILQVRGRHGQTEQETQRVDAYLDYNTQVGYHLPHYYGWLLDGPKYGLGLIGAYWCNEIKAVSRFEKRNKTLNGIPLVGETETVKVTEELKGYQGNKLFNVRPYDYLPDTRVPLIDPDAGEFQGWKHDLPWNDVLRGASSGQYINVDKLRDLVRNVGRKSERYSTRWTEYPGESQSADGYADPTMMNSAPCYSMVVELSPVAWGLGKTEFPEKWLFTVADESLIIEAHPYGALHNRFPIRPIEIEFDPHSVYKRGLMEIGDPLSKTLDWLVNSHMYNVRKTLNGEIIYDPSMISSRDMSSPEPGKRIRLREEAWGQDIRRSIYQLDRGGDVTGTHLRDAEFVTQLMQRVLGVSDNVMGAVNPGGRKTATEIRQSNGASMNRMKTLAEYISAAGFEPLTQIMLGNAQQYYDAEMEFRIAGDLTQSGARSVLVSKEALAGEYSFAPVDGSMPIDKFALVNTWVQMMQQAQRMPPIMQNYHWDGIFAWVAQLAGLKNINQFRINVQPNPGEMRGADPTVPIGEVLNDRPAADPGVARLPPRPRGSGPEGTEGRTATTRQVPGMGPAA